MEARTSSTLSDVAYDDRAGQIAPKDTPATTTRGLDALKDIAFGSIAGAAGKVIEFPFDTVKVRLQSQPDHAPLLYKGPLDCFRQSLAADGLRGLYRGISAPITGAAAETACLFFSYRVAQDLLRSASGHDQAEPLPLPALIGAAALSGAVTSLVLTPIELVKCRVQVPRHVSPTDLTLRPGAYAAAPLSPLLVISDVYRRDGLRGFWRGQLGTFVRETGGTAAWFGAYEASTAYFRRQPGASNERGLSVWQQMMSGALAGMSYNFLFYPADTIKSKMQTAVDDDGGRRQGRRPTFLRVGAAVWRAHGLAGLYRGCAITVARSAPSSALIFTIMERLKATFS